MGPVTVKAQLASHSFVFIPEGKLRGFPALIY